MRVENVLSGVLSQSLVYWLIVSLEEWSVFVF